jgi:cell division protein FtsQ
MRMMAELDADGKHNSEQISEIDLTDPEDARVLMPEQGADILAHFGEDHFLERYERYQAHIGDWRQQYPHLAAVDLRYDNQVVLEMASGKETSAAPNGDTGDAGTLKPSPAAASAPPAAKPAAKSAAGKSLAAKSSPAKSSAGKSLAAKKSKSAQNRKRAAAKRRAAAAKTSKRKTVEDAKSRASTTRPTAATHGASNRPQHTPTAAVAQGG